MSEADRAVVVLLTPPGRGAVATLRVEGAGATDLVARHFRAANGKPLARQPVGRIVFGRWGSAEGEELVVARRGEEQVEVHCHGGTAAAAALISALSAGGCRPIDWRQWVGRHEPDPIRAAARVALAEARTAHAAAVLLDQHQGALSGALGEILCWLEADRREAAGRRLRDLVALGPVGLHLTHPWQIVVAGRPNVGKSSLINALVGYQRSIVFDQPGTTRDTVTASTAFGGWPVELTDTAGLRQSREEVEAAGVAQAQAVLAAADQILLVLDASTEQPAADQAQCSAWPGALRVYNKCDLLSGQALKHLEDGVLVSALTGEGLAGLIEKIAAELLPPVPPPGSAVPFLPEHMEALQAALDELQAGAVAQTRAAIAELLT